VTQATAPVVAAESTYDAAEGFWSVVWRRTRYALAIALSAILFSWLGWMIAPPNPQWAGFSIGIWQSQNPLATLLLALVLLVVTGICSLIVHPDSPHMGLFCSLAGMAALSIRGGSVHLLMVYGQLNHNLPHLANAMALECLQWGLVALLADFFARFLHDKLLANHHWLLRSEPELAKRKDAQAKVGGAHGFSKSVSAALQTDRMKGPIRIPLAMLVHGGLGFLFLYMLMQSQLKGQVLMACFVAFLGAAIAAYHVFPTARFGALFLRVR